MGLGEGKQLQTCYAEQDQNQDQKPGLDRVEMPAVGGSDLMTTLPDVAFVEFGTPVWESNHVNSNYALDLSLPRARIMYLSIFRDL